MCGERVEGVNLIAREHGSSPRVRGTPLTPKPRTEAHRFIPACAGNARRRAAHTASRPVHPRVCGERFPISRRQCRPRGSSPRVRGTLRNDDANPGLLRFIPACAGNAGYRVFRFATLGVHPRVCGERRCSSSTSRRSVGSSPRVRGTRSGVMFSGLVVRFIPACAGNAPSPCMTP